MSIYKMHSGPTDCKNTKAPGTCDHNAKRGDSCYQFECAETVVCRLDGQSSPLKKCPVGTWNGHVIKAISMACDCARKVTCTNGRVFAPCAHTAAPTCAKPFPTASSGCNRGCRCPANQYYDEKSSSCVTYEKCPSTHRIEFVSSIYQMGKYPYINNNGQRLTAKTVTDCEGMCLKDPKCNYGTFVNAKTANAAGECWLSGKTHNQQTLCGVACTSFEKVQGSASATKIRSPAVHGTWKIGDPIKFCQCDPAANPSTFTICDQATFGYEIKVTHLAPKFHTTPYKVGTQHICKMIAPGKCSCCSCHPTHKNAMDIKGIGIGLHTAKAPFLNKGTANLQSTLLACQKQCSDTPTCKAGTWITSGYDKGECWLSANIAKTPKQCEKPCSSFVKVMPLSPVKPSISAP